MLSRRNQLCIFIGAGSLCKETKKESTMNSNLALQESHFQCESSHIVKLFGTNTVACKEKLDCQWAIALGYGNFCSHPSSLKYSNGQISRLFA